MRSVNADKPRENLSELVQAVEKARARLLEVVEGLIPEQIEAPVAEGRWSPLQYVEHLVRAEEATLWRMFGAVEDGQKGLPGPQSSTPQESIEEVAARTWPEKVEAPPLAVPEWGGSVAYWTARLKRNAGLVETFGELVTENELDSVAYNHPISGPFTMRQGLEFIRFHIERHRDHIAEANSGP